MPAWLAKWFLNLVFRHDDGKDEVEKHPGKACGKEGEEEVTYAHQRGVYVEVFGDAAAYTESPCVGGGSSESFGHECVVLRCNRGVFSGKSEPASAFSAWNPMQSKRFF